MRIHLAFKGTVIYVFAILLSVGKTMAQDPQFSQYYANPIYTNPAFAGGSNVGRAVINYRSQWPGIAGTFRTFSASYDEHFDKLNGGIGFIATADEAGVGTLRTLSFSGVYSYQIILSRYLTLRASVQAGFFQKTIDFSKLTFYDQLVRQRGFVNPTQEQPITEPVFGENIAAGMVLYSSKFYAGFAVHNLTEPKQGFYDQSASAIPRRYTAHAGLIIPVVESRDAKKSSNLYPSVLYMQQREFNQVNIGMYYNQGPFVIGGYFRQNNMNSDAFIAIAGIRTPKVKVGFSYDATVSRIRYGARQSYEVSLSFELRKRAPKKKVRNIVCPQF
ncbi:MAG: type IX secretion system membrane protein PorP/SprF [Bacteroidia bacterium]|jgi:type IX secretion system PorP/SprF family membrane protein|nr:type IX secretion system membrane protein PorP/SprF [Bacteroidia bacterium]